jgi:hypothetical protein
MMHPGVYYLSLPRGAPRPAHVVGSGAVLRVARRCRTRTTSLYCSRGYPRLRVLTILFSPVMWFVHPLSIIQLEPPDA